MFFVGRKTTAQFQLTTPLDCCCNCGTGGDIDLVFLIPARVLKVEAASPRHP
jgi:hypothetical protein